MEPKSYVLNRRGFFRWCAAATTLTIRADGQAGDPWSQKELIEPAALASQLASNAQQPHILCVTFPFLYRQKRIPHAQFAGPGEKPEGIEKLRSAVVSLPKSTSIVVYCGCCPMDKCPNIRPAYRALQELGFKNIRILNLPTNFHTDWTAKGYPVET